jgi:tetratricopeptide (TPR) repeat protein
MSNREEIGMELTEKIYGKILDLCAVGDQMAETGEYDQAIEKYSIPHPKNEWETSTWVYSALGDVCFLKGDYKEATEYFYHAYNCPDGLSNPFVLLRLGQSLYEYGDTVKAREFLLRAYLLAETDIFQDEDGKYLELILSDIKE